MFFEITKQGRNVHCFRKLSSDITTQKKAAADKSLFFLLRVKFVGHIIERNAITPIKSRIEAIG